MKKIKGIVGFGLFLLLPYFLFFYLSDFYLRGGIIMDTNLGYIRFGLGILLISIWLIFSISLFIKSKTTN